MNSRNRCLPRLWSTLRPLTLAGRRRPLHTKGHLRRCPCILRRTSTRTCPLRNHSKLLPMTTSILPVHIGLPRTGSRYKLCPLHHPFHRGCRCRQHNSGGRNTARISQYFSAPNTGIAYLRIADEIRQKRDFNIAERGAQNTHTIQDPLRMVRQAGGRKGWRVLPPAQKTKKMKSRDHFSYLRYADACLCFCACTNGNSNLRQQRV